MLTDSDFQFCGMIVGDQRVGEIVVLERQDVEADVRSAVKTESVAGGVRVDRIQAGFEIGRRGDCKMGPGALVKSRRVSSP